VCVCFSADSKAEIVVYIKISLIFFLFLKGMKVLKNFCMTDGSCNIIWKADLRNKRRMASSSVNDTGGGKGWDHVTKTPREAL